MHGFITETGIRATWQMNQIYQAEFNLEHVLRRRI